MSYFPQYFSLYHIASIIWNILSMTFTVVESDGMIEKSREVKHIIMMTRTSKMNDKFYDEVELLILQVETKIDKIEKRKVMSINKEILGSFTLLFVIYFITLVQLSPQIIHLYQRFLNITV
ncbi:unnamed protein product [Nezara viridula]|uniref:Uncharacterized protein n=1 Tax=Nezara viridula TaxID=85310 RepID=A0A9P0MNN5_NEZVI|nr:unnamed protein product [Nezara viridula]